MSAATKRATTAAAKGKVANVSVAIAAVGATATKKQTAKKVQQAAAKILEERKDAVQDAEDAVSIAASRATGSR